MLHAQRLSVACAFVTAELEERSAVRSALLWSDEDVESCGLMGMIKSYFFVALYDLFTIRCAQWTISHVEICVR